MEHEIRSEKILIKKIFSEMWFRIPEYQRPYIWSRDEVCDLLDDLSFAQTEKPDQEYFLGSFVFQAKKAGDIAGQKFDENDLLDGQQRMTTLLMLFACIRDLSDDAEVRRTCQESIFQSGNDIDDIPERPRIAFAIRQEVQDFVDEYLKTFGGTKRGDDLTRWAETSKDPSVPNMARAILDMHGYLQDTDKAIELKAFLKFLRNRVLLIYVATESLDDAFRLFMILNDRGKPLRNSDILKSMNLGALERDSDKTRYAKLWEDAEGELADDFDRFLNYVRTILVKEKARLNLLQEFEDRIYDPKEKDRSTGKVRPTLLKKGKETFHLIERYLEYYEQLFQSSNYDFTGKNFEFDNLVKVMLTGLPSSDWIPPLLLYYGKFKHEGLLNFLVQLDNKFSADWIAGKTPTDRIEGMNKVMRVIESSSTTIDVLSNDCFSFNELDFMRTADASIYGRRYTRYLLLKLDFYFQDHSHRMGFETLSVEHVLPQNPSSGSQWLEDFQDDADRSAWTDRLGNLVLITAKKNSSQGNADFESKKTRYFAKRISACPNSLRVLNHNAKWTPTELKANHELVMSEIKGRYKVSVTAV